MNVEVTVSVPADIAAQLAAHGLDVSRSLLEAFALENYRAGKLSAAQVRRLLGLNTRMETDAFLKHHGVELEYTIQDLERERAALARL